MTTRLANAKDLRLLNNDILLKHRPVKKDTIIQVDDDVHQDTLLRYDVIRTSSHVKYVEEGQVVVLPWRNCTPPFEVELDGMEVDVVLTDEHNVMGIIENDDE